MTTTIEQGIALVAGYLWSIRIEMDEAAFPVGVAVKGQVRYKVADPIVLAHLSTIDGSLIRVNDTQIDVIIDGDISKDWKAGDVVFDLVRTDLDPDQYLGFQMVVPVVRTVTRDLP